MPEKSVENLLNNTMHWGKGGGGLEGNLILQFIIIKNFWVHLYIIGLCHCVHMQIKDHCCVTIHESVYKKHKSVISYISLWIIVCSLKCIIGKMNTQHSKWRRISKFTGVLQWLKSYKFHGRYHYDYKKTCGEVYHRFKIIG